MNKRYDVIVMGGGVIGLSAAIAMNQRGYDVAVLDAGELTADCKSSTKRVYAINQASTHFLQKLGVWQHLKTIDRSPYRRMRVWDSYQEAAIEFDACSIAKDRLGTIIEESPLKNSLLTSAIAHGVDLIPNRRVSCIDVTSEEALIHDKESKWPCHLLMIADGATSTARQLLKVPITTWPYHQHALVCTVHTEKPHQHTAYQVFTPNGPLAFLPLSHPHQCSIVWSSPPTYTTSLMAKEPRVFNTLLTEAFCDVLGACELLDERLQFPLVMRHVKQYHGRHWMLLGDAAHTIHPLAGLGLNVGLEDVATWSLLMDEMKGSLCTNKRLAAYQRRRKHAVWKVILMMDALKWLFMNPLPPVQAIRGVGLRLCNAQPSLKRFFIEQAAGKHF